MDILFLFMFATSVHIVVCSYFIKQPRTTWGNQNCQLAVPILSYKSNTPYLDSSVNISGLNIPSEGVWIGFNQARITYTYAGCSRKDETVGQTYDVQTFGDCMAATGCRTFGIWMSNGRLKCTCATTVEVFANKSCNSRCKVSDFEFPCGSAENRSLLMSVYNTENNTIREAVGTCTECSCLVVRNTYSGTRIFKWYSCMKGSSLNPLCSYKSFSDQAQFKNVVFTTLPYINQWVLASEVCCTEGHYPATYTGILNTNFSKDVVGVDHWTGIIRTLSTMKITEQYKSNEMAAVAVLLENRSIHFKELSTDKKKSLCNNDQSTTLIPSKASTPLTVPLTSTANMTTKDRTKHSILDTTTVTVLLQIPKETTASFAKDESESTTGLVAGLSVSLASFIVVTIIMLLFLKRRRLLPKWYKPTGQSSNDKTDTSTDISVISTPVFESTTNQIKIDTHTANNHSYFILERTFNESNKDGDEEYAEPVSTDVDHDITETSEKDIVNDYDTTDSKHGFANSGLAKQYDNYNTVSLNQTDEYDHTHWHGNESKLGRQTENDYDISNNVINSKRNKSFGDNSDTYDHFHQHNLKSYCPDDVYEMQETDGGSEYDTSGALNGSRNAASKELQNDYAVIKKNW